jgi:hypothetical protein
MANDFAELDNCLSIDQAPQACEKARRAKNALNFPADESDTDVLRTRRLAL